MKHPAASGRGIRADESCPSQNSVHIEFINIFSQACQNPFVERLIGSIHRDCLDQVIVLNESHLRRILSS